ncbi:hypothetical protein DXG03_001257, partial [Asterophora parasitica]
MSQLLVTAKRRPRPRTLLPVVLVLVSLVLLSYFASFHIASNHTKLVSNPEVLSPGPRILLVSALFPLKHAKHTQDDYSRWLTHFLGPSGLTHTDVYFFTTPELAPLFESLNNNISQSQASSPYSHRTLTRTLTINTTYTTPFAIPPLLEHRDRYAQMHAWDRERARHGQDGELYAVWNAKPCFVREALRNANSAGRSYDYAFWTDAGAFRTPHAYRVWPDPKRVEEVFRSSSSGEREDKVLMPLYMLPTRQEYDWRTEKGPVDGLEDFSQGQFCRNFFLQL